MTAAEHIARLREVVRDWRERAAREPRYADVLLASAAVVEAEITRMENRDE